MNSSAPIKKLTNNQSVTYSNNNINKLVEISNSNFANNKNFIDLQGKIVYVNRRNRKVFRIYNEQLGKEFKCFYEGFLPVHIGDAIMGKCIFEKSPYGERYRFILPPFSIPGNNKDSIIQCFFTALKGRRFGGPNAYKLYENIQGKCQSGETPDKYLSELSELWRRSHDETLLTIFKGVLSEKQTRELLTWWYKNRVLRKLYLLGLTNKEIYSIDLAPQEIYEQCIKNPYVLPQLSMDKCEEILLRMGIKPSHKDLVCGKIIRQIYHFMVNRQWVCTPIKLLCTMFPDLVKHFKYMCSEYHIIGDKEYKMLYMRTPYLVETGLVKYFTGLMLKTVYDPQFNTKTHLNERQNFNGQNNISGERLIDVIPYKRKSLTEDQKEAVIGALTNNVSIISGAAGTGKTTCIDEIVYQLELIRMPYLIVSFTGKAVARIKEVVKNSSPMTIHRAIYNCANVKKFKHLIVDETSMVTTKLFHDFVQVFDNIFGKDKYKVTFIGDPNQLQPINYGNLYTELIESKRIPHYKLHNVHRTSNDKNNGILVNATKIINHCPLIDKNFVFFKAENFTLAQGNENDLFYLLKKFSSKGITSDRITIITPYNAYLPPLNKEYQQIFNGQNKYVVDLKGKRWYIGDRVMMNVNNYTINVMNGEEGKVVGLTETDIIVEFREKERHKFSLVYKDYKKLENGEFTKADKLSVQSLNQAGAMTVHKSQGSEWDVVFFFVPQRRSNEYFLNKNMIYTAITRAKSLLYIVGDIIAVTKACIKKPKVRCEKLKNRLEKLMNLDIPIHQPVIDQKHNILMPVEEQVDKCMMDYFNEYEAEEPMFFDESDFE